MSLTMLSTQVRVRYDQPCKHTSVLRSLNQRSIYGSLLRVLGHTPTRNV